MAPAQKPRTPKRLPLSPGGRPPSRALRGSLRSGQTPGSAMNRCADARAVAATVPGAGVGNEGCGRPWCPARRPSSATCAQSLRAADAAGRGEAHQVGARSTGEVDSREEHGLEGGGQIG